MLERRHIKTPNCYSNVLCVSTLWLAQVPLLLPCSNLPNCQLSQGLPLHYMQRNKVERILYSKLLKCLCSIVSLLRHRTGCCLWFEAVGAWEGESMRQNSGFSLHQAPGSQSRLHCTFVSKVGISIRLLIWCGKSRDQQRLSIKSAEEQGSRVHCGQGGGQGAGPTLWIQDYEPWWPPAVSSPPPDKDCAYNYAASTSTAACWGPLSALVLEFVQLLECNNLDYYHLQFNFTPF